MTLEVVIICQVVNVAHVNFIGRSSIKKFHWQEISIQYYPYVEKERCSWTMACVLCCIALDMDRKQICCQIWLLNSTDATNTS